MVRCSMTLCIAMIVLMCSWAVSQEVSSQQDTPEKAPPSSSRNVQFQQRDPRYRLHKSDVVEIKFKLSPEFDQTVTVQPDGFINLDGASDVNVEGKTLPEATEVIRHAYQGILHEPVITVVLKDFEKPFFIAAGQVGHPGKYELRSDTTLVEALSIAGDFTSASKHSQVVLFRHISPETVEARVFDVKRMLSTRNLEEDPHLLPGDLVFVPQNKISKLQRYLPSTNMGAYLSPSTF
jgi:polysaccharide export outer membrane protein